MDYFENNQRLGGVYNCSTKDIKSKKKKNYMTHYDSSQYFTVEAP